MYEAQRVVKAPAKDPSRNNAIVISSMVQTTRKNVYLNAPNGPVPSVPQTRPGKHPTPNPPSPTHRGTYFFLSRLAKSELVIQ
jgi:hypothetical protein